MRGKLDISDHFLIIMFVFVLLHKGFPQSNCVAAYMDDSLLVAALRLLGVSEIVAGLKN